MFINVTNTSLKSPLPYISVHVWLFYVIIRDLRLHFCTSTLLWPFIKACLYLWTIQVCCSECLFTCTVLVVSHLCSESVTERVYVSACMTRSAEWSRKCAGNLTGCCGALPLLDVWMAMWAAKWCVQADYHPGWSVIKLQWSSCGNSLMDSVTADHTEGLWVHAF